MGQDVRVINFRIIIIIIIKMPLGTKVGLVPSHIVLDGGP